MTNLPTQLNFIIQNQNAPEEAEKAEAEESWLKDWEEEQALRKRRVQKVQQQTFWKFRTSIVVTANYRCKACERRSQMLKDATNDERCLTGVPREREVEGHLAGKPKGSLWNVSGVCMLLRCFKIVFLKCHLLC